MSSSLRSRQLVSGFSIIVVGILILGILLHLSLSERRKDEASTKLKQTALTVLGFLEFHDDKDEEKSRFFLSHATKDDALRYLSKERLNYEGERKRFAYIIDTDKKKLVWRSTEPVLPNITASKASQELVGEEIVYFDFEKISQNPAVRSSPLKSIILELEPAPHSPQSPWPTTEHDEHLKTSYLVAVQAFRYGPGNYIFIVAESLEQVQEEMSNLRQTFAVLFFVSVVLILIAQLASSFWIVAPIKEFESEVRALESGDQELITDEYPEELVPLKTTINALVSYEKGQRQRSKDSLDDLAHSLKTPLAAIQSQIDLAGSDPVKAQLAMASIANEVDQMKERISYQLRKAIVTSKSAIIISQEVRPVVLRLAETMKKVYRDKDFEIKVNVDEYAKCRLDQEDLMELMGMLISNACRYCDRLVEITATRSDGMLVVYVDDDGMGFPSENPAKLLQRGIREDSKTEGQGIGLAVSTEIVSAVGGTIELKVSPQVGARVELHLPI